MNKEIKRVLFISTVANNIYNFSTNLIDILQNDGYEIHIASNFEHITSVNNKKAEEIKAYFIEKNIILHQIDFSRNVLNPHNITSIVKCISICKNYKFDFIHCHTPMGGVAGRLAAYFSKTKVIYTAHGFHFFKGSSKFSWLVYYPIEYILSKITDILVTVNKEDYNLALKKMRAKYIVCIPGVGIPTSLITKISSNNDNKLLLNEYKTKIDDKIILSVGELNKNKNHELIIRSMVDIDNYVYVIAGYGVLNEYLINLVEKLKLNTRVHFLGYRDNIVELCSACDVFVFPSHREGLPISLLQAMACKKVCIVSNIRGNNELIIDKKYLFNPNCVNEFKECLSNYDNLTDIERSKVEFNNYNTSLKYDINEVNKIMSEVYKKIYEV